MSMDKPLPSRWTPARRWPTRPAAWRTERPVYVDRLPPCNNAVPGRRRHPGLAVPRRIRQLRSRLAPPDRDNPFPAIMGRVCYHSCEGACNRGQLDSPVGINSVERFLGDEAIKRAGSFDSPPLRIAASTCWWSAPGPRACRPPTTCAASATGDRGRSRPADGRHDALRHSQVPPAARSARRRDAAHRGHGRQVQLNTKIDNIWQSHEGWRQVRRRLPGRRRAHRQARLHPGQGQRRASSTRVRAAQHGRRRQADARPPRGGLRRRQHRDRRGAHRQAHGRHRADHRLPPHTRQDARRTTSRSKKRCRKA
jgi:hypothetical protein